MSGSYDAKEALARGAGSLLPENQNLVVNWALESGSDDAKEALVEVIGTLAPENQSKIGRVLRSFMDAAGGYNLGRYCE